MDIAHDLIDLLQAVAADHPMFGDLAEGELKMPRDPNPDGRVLTWPKFLKGTASKVINKPYSRNDCWYAPSTKDDGYHESKISKDGSKNKFRTHRLLRVLVEPDAYSIVNDRNKEQQGAHRCGHGKSAKKGEGSCINPYHISFSDCKTNQDAKGCKNGAAFLCPHTPTCIWTDTKTGAYKPCRSDKTKRTCSCANDCFLISSL